MQEIAQNYTVTEPGKNQPMNLKLASISMHVYDYYMG